MLCRQRQLLLLMFADKLINATIQQSTDPPSSLRVRPPAVRIVRGRGRGQASGTARGRGSRDRGTETGRRGRGRGRERAAPTKELT